VIHFFGDGIQAGDDVSQTFSIGQLGECHDTKVVGAFEGLNFGIASIAINTSLKASPRNTIHELGEDEFALVHGPDEGDGCPKNGISN
jgi:hypothetical protein